RARVATLSGGNQQKVAFARLLHQEADVLLLDEPTRGVDVATKSEIYRTIGELAAAGKAIVIASSHFPELLHVCDRIAVLERGVLRAVKPASEWDEASLLRVASGVGS
ncbi:MAG TPA: ATP-binding cassette domain-containing protein, partial [Planctomycetota bacterium]|nr:ATP-binding cassette domain-containing protein [Planctomycetota bacterium]